MARTTWGRNGRQRQNLLCLTGCPAGCNSALRCHWVHGCCKTTVVLSLEGVLSMTKRRVRSCSVLGSRNRWTGGDRALGVPRNQVQQKYSEKCQCAVYSATQYPLSTSPVRSSSATYPSRVQTSRWTILLRSRVHLGHYGLSCCESTRTK